MGVLFTSLLVSGAEVSIMFESVCISEPWIMSMLIIFLFNFLLTVTYWIYTFYSMYNHSTPTSPIPHILLFGLTLGSIASFMSVTLSPSSSLYQLMSEIIFFTYSIIFSSMFIRLLYLRSLSSGIFLPFTYQTLLLAFIVLVQLSLSLQKLAMLDVKAGPQTDLMSLLYLTFLLLSLVTFSTTTRNVSVRREAAYIWLLTMSAVAIWLGWVSIALIFDQFYHKIKSTESLFLCLFNLSLMLKVSE